MTRRIILLILMSLLLLTYSVTANEDEEHTELSFSDWVGHAILSIIGLVLAISVVVTGAELTGRFKRKVGAQTFKIHRVISILFSIFMIGSFIYGLLITSENDTLLLSSAHGWLGLIIVIFAVLQIFPSILIKKRIKIKYPHMIFGYSLLVLVVLQVILGLHISVLEDVKILVLIHSIGGGFAALALIWIVIEMMHPTNEGIKRAKAAGFLAAFFNIIGCWIIGGYNYLIDYGSNVKPIILSGSLPWAHQIFMETKEHVFIFLPILSILLAIIFFILGKDYILLNDRKARHGVILITIITLFMILLMFVMGAFISYVGNFEAGGI